jgi:alginate O-acetyltransferase complex protein AlgI
MLFNSLEFLFVYLPIVAVTYFLLNARISPAAGRSWLAVASIFFYGYWDFRYVPLLAASIAMNFLVGRRIAAAVGGDKRSWLIGGICGNLAILVYYKYTGFFLGTLNAAVGLELAMPNIVLPLGISFFTFTQIAYLVDAYSEKIPAYSFASYTLFVSYFPHLLAGPILHHAQMMPQFGDSGRARFDANRFCAGLALFAAGIAKKMLIADQVAPLANAGFHNVQALAFGPAWMAAIAYTIQIYFDFSGYTDMARGISKMFNIELPVNFNSPYQARNLQDFWQRWHMTLSRFLRDYVFFSIGGGRRHPLAPYAATVVTFAIAGLWHGANWTFVVWGLLNGLGIVLVRQTPFQLPAFAARTLTFVSVTVLWVWFRATSVVDAWHMTGTMLGRDGLSLSGYPEKPLLLIMTGALFFVWFVPSSQKLLDRPKWTPQWQVALGILLALSIASFEHASEFLYFNF